MKKIVGFTIIICILLSVAAFCAPPKQVDPQSFDGRRYLLAINRLMPKALDCYNEALKKEPTLAGDLKVKVTVNTEGKTDRVEVLEKTLNNEEVISCVKNHLNDASWPAEDYPVFFNYTFHFSPAKVAKGNQHVRS